MTHLRQVFPQPHHTGQTCPPAPIFRNMETLLLLNPAFSLPSGPWNLLVLKWHCLPLWDLPESFIDSELSLKSAETETRGCVSYPIARRRSFGSLRITMQLPYLHSIWKILLSCNLCLKLIKHYRPPFLTHCNCCSSLALPFDKWQQSCEMQLKQKPKRMYILSFNLLRWPHDFNTIISISDEKLGLYRA